MVTEDQNLLQLSAIFSALGSTTRLRIIEIIRKTERPLHIKAVAQMLKRDYAAVYRHIGVLENCGLIGVYEVGRSRVIYLKKAALINECVGIVQNMLLTR
jgi:DNA-binding transcriptional ArsR family regulator